MNYNKKSVLFICTHNSARSQMAEGLLNNLYENNYEAYSAGTNPSSINPNALKVMNEIGINISKNRAKNIKEFQNMSFDYVVTVCNQAKEVCPFFPSKKIIHKGFDDPSTSNGETGDIVDEFRRVRDEIKNWIIEIFG